MVLGTPKKQQCSIKLPGSSPYSNNVFLKVQSLYVIETMSLFSIRQGLVYLLAGASFVNGAAIHRRDEIAHDSVVGLPETVPDDDMGALYQKFQPFLKVDSGCVPFPAVDAEGNTK